MSVFDRIISTTL